MVNKDMVLVLHRMGRDGLPKPVISVIDQRLVNTMVREIARVTGVRIATSATREARVEPRKP